MALLPMPDLLLLNDHGGQWDQYCKAVYQEFLNSVVRTNLAFLGKRISCQYRPDMNGMHFSFWHLVTENLDRSGRDDDRTPDFRRCERIRWIAHVLQHAERPESGVFCWCNKRGSDRNVVLWVKEEDFVVILTERGDYFMLKTMYVLGNEHSRRKFEKERLRSKDPRVAP